ncbi:MAG: 16S rRNA (uracil(1498)-N(3))-methyltransferase [Clostridiales bacterium]|nr:16S rRNA (uracil(1498)-N(3))-methyltransferase [Clostridiales bacterium]
MYNFFVEPAQIQGNTITITGNDVNHIKNVLRMKIGEEISVSNGIDKKEYRCGIEDIEEEKIVCKLRFVKEDGMELPSRVYLFQGLPKADKMELIIQKAVELGVYEVIPVAAKRAVVKLDERKAKAKRGRWQGIAESAAKQSKRRIIPQIKEVMTMQEAVRYASGMEVRLIPYELAEGMQETKNIISSLKKEQSIAVFIGPEGGFEENEIKEATDNGIVPITMGKRILRTETAGLTILAWIMYQLEE